MLCGLYTVTSVEVVEHGRRRVETDVSRALIVTGSRIAAKMLEFAAEVTLEQTFFNPYGDVTASYIVPLDPKAAICGFTSIVNGVETKAVVQDKRAALQTYNTAVARGDSAQLLERQRDDVFQMRVGGVRAGDNVIIRITYVTQLDIVDGSIQFFMPTRVVPRYQPGTDNSDGFVGVGALPTSNGVQIEVTCITASPIKNIMSPTYAVTTAAQDARTWVVSARLQELMKDFVLQVFTEDAPQANLFVEKATDGSHACMLTFVPKIASSSCPSEFVLMIDCSGSMAGDPLAQAKVAKDIFVRSLPEGCFFNIVCFGSTFTRLWSRSIAYTTETRQTALDWKLMDMGGTELFAALKSVLTGSLSERVQSLYKTPLNRQVVILTDGCVSNTSDIGKLVASHRSTTRCFCLGIGRGVSHDLVDRVARNGGGTADYVHDVESLPRAVARLLADAMQPCMANVTVNWNVALPPPPYTDQAASAQSVFGAFATTSVQQSPVATTGVRQSPKEVPALFNGRRFVVYVLLDPTIAPPASVRVETDGTAFDVPVSRMFDEGATLHTLAARALIRDLENTAGLRSDVWDEIVRLGIAYNLASSQTSFVAVQPRMPRMCAESAVYMACDELQSLQLQCEQVSVGHKFCKTATKLSKSNFSLTGSISRAATRISEAWNSMLASPEEDDADECADVPHVTQAVPQTPAVVSLQEINGSWLPTTALAQAMSLTSDQLRTDAVLATILAIEWIKKKFGDDETYALMLTKAKRWLAQKGIAASDARWEQARQLLAI